MVSAARPLSDNDGIADFVEGSAKRLAGMRRELDKHPSSVMRIGAADEEPLLDHRFQPPQSGRRRNCRGYAKARDRYAKVTDLGLEQVEQHVPCRVGEQIFGKVTGTQAAG